MPENAPWLAGFEREVLGFPNLKHDDQVDALTQLFDWRQRERTRIALFSEAIPIDFPDY